MIVKPCQLPELGDLGASPLGDRHNRWGVSCVDKFLRGRNWKLDFTIGFSSRETVGDVTTSSISSLEDPSQLLHAGLLEKGTLGCR